ncbi:2,3,4,5-tetrahydropyridine-2,6-dicarboxylate N-acetyltransferase [Halalkalicoccus paucihalophilus]|uniref:2,3,4,5-tetrahydropyridine-2,6-dicarboxylate N-acetyltransferase n=1 Tax=Halalkalicoccus paucihalophilus TaxID=1008153 RepID=A0A151A978_9EURY|nr:acyltransferase [Halalkalicoccus paucihalophilus]KYH24110.1 2,3,4,5-tetrahydropyridine-2,6-dicarboxylate N-acetyltransferase [Halalkalicoccus paucihalophilus]
MLREIERAVVENPVTNAILFNELTGSIGQYFEAARYRREYARYRRKYDVDPTFRFNGPGILLYGDGDIKLGADSYIGRYSRIQAESGRTVRIGRNTAVSHFVFCYTRNRIADQDMSVAPNTNDDLAVNEGDTTVGDDCWIGAFTFLTEGVSVGENTVIGANAVVTNDLPPHAIAAGVPARVRRFKSYLSDEETGTLATEYADALSDDLAGEYR